jgi:hypothetical protein
MVAGDSPSDPPSSLDVSVQRTLKRPVAVRAGSCMGLQCLAGAEMPELSEKQDFATAESLAYALRPVRAWSCALG